MAASLTLSAVAVAADGKTITATIGGGTAPYSISSVAGLLPHLGTGNKEGFVVSSASVSGTTLTLVTGSTMGTSDSIQLDIATSSTLTDSAANTPTGQSNLVATNSSAVAVTTVAATSGQFELTGLFSGTQFRSGASLQNAVDSFSVEFVANCTEMAILGYSASLPSYQLDESTTVNSTAANGFWSVVPAAAGLTATAHLFRISAGDYFSGVRLVGGTRSITSVPTTKRTIKPNTSSFVGVPQASPVAWRGEGKAGNYDGTVNVGQNYVGFELNCAISGASGLEISTVLDRNGAWAATIDGGQPGALLPGGDNTLHNYYGYVPLAANLAPGSSHTITATQVGTGTNETHSYVRAINGTALSASCSAGDTTITVASAATISVNDWIWVDKWENREWRRVTAINGNVLTLSTALAKAHTAPAGVVSYMAPAGTISAYNRTPQPTVRLIAMGDSNTQGANEYGLGGGGVTVNTPDQNGNYYSSYDPRASAIFYAADPLGYEVVNLGIQGTTSVDMVNRKADFGTVGRGSANWVTIWAGTNDINSNTTTPAQFQANIDTLVTAAEANLAAGGKVVLLPTGTPGSTSANGLNNAAVLTALQAVAANHPSTTVVDTSLLSGLVAGDYNGLHYMTSGRQKIAANLQPYIGGAAAPVAAVLTGMFASC